ncbi:C-type lectin domain containing ema isoform X1 [Rhipicephalus microplus]|uniref:C-type lectin domain containing ema isoform X1 n=1 Tax=Rhipicephalus microplus TaxID=6941 RepID=UPI003F6C42EE
MFRNKGWFSGGLWKPKNPHSLEHLKYLYHLLSKNQTVTEQNKSILVETLRSIAEILIWGDQNDSTVFDFFLEKNMLSFFLKIMKQKCGRYVCVQLLQTLNILFENIRNETSLYYLLSNNHVNSIIVHKFDFSDEEVMAYYISFLKTLSLKLNNHTIHFFYNEHTNDFPLYTEAIKFFNHNESMVRIAVRTLTLNVFKEANASRPEGMLQSKHKRKNGRVEDRAMLKFIRDRTAAPYFSNLVYFIGKHVLELDSCVTHAEHGYSTRLSDLVAEHLDHLHYVNDILCLRIEALNAVLTDHLLNRLLVPLYVYSLVQGPHPCLADDRKKVSSIVSLFLLSQVFLIVSHEPLVRQLANIILNRDMKVFTARAKEDSASNKSDLGSEPEFVAPEETLEKSLETWTSAAPASEAGMSAEEEGCHGDPPHANSSAAATPTSACPPGGRPPSVPCHPEDGDHSQPASSTDCEVNPAYLPDGLNITDEQKAEAVQRLNMAALEQLSQGWPLCERPFLAAVLNALDCSENDHPALFALCLLYALGHNPGINRELLDTVLMPSLNPETKHWYNVALMDKLIQIIALSCKYGTKVRLATLEMSLLLLRQLATIDGESCLQDHHLAGLEQAKEESTLLLRNFYKSEEMFLDMFEDEYQEMKKKPLNVEYLMMDANLLLPPMGTPMSGVEFHKRLPCGEVERMRRAIRVFFLLRELSLFLSNDRETQLPLTNLASCVKVDDVLDLNNSDLIACTVVSKDTQKIRRFMVIDVAQLVLVEPDAKRLGWGVAKFVGFLQDIEVTGDKEDSRCLHITVHSRGSASRNASGPGSVPLLAARFLFDDHIRCMAAKQRLNKGRMRARQRKMHSIARLLDLPLQPPSPLRHHPHTPRAPCGPAASLSAASSLMHRSLSQDTGLRGRAGTAGAAGPPTHHQPYRPLFTTSSKVPGFATARSGHRGSAGDIEGRQRRRSGSSPVSRGRSTSRESSPRLGHRSRDHSEEIPLEDLSTRVTGSQSPVQMRPCSGSPIEGSSSGVCKKPRSEETAMDQSASPEVGAPAVSLVVPSTDFEVPLLLPPKEGSATTLPSPPSSVDEMGDSPATECRKPCCFSETSFSEGSGTAEHCNGDFSEDTATCRSSSDETTVLGTEVVDDGFEATLTLAATSKAKDVWCAQSSVFAPLGTSVQASSTQLRRPFSHPSWI